MANESVLSDYNPGRAPKDEQMKALRKAHGEPKRQNTLPPYVSEKSLEEKLPKGEED